jgi:hypothetical protein
MRATELKNRNLRPTRTLGLSLAILVSVMWFSLLPMMQAAAIFLVEWRLREAEQGLALDDDLPAFAYGGEFRGVSEAVLWFQILSGSVFLVIAAAAWRGRPRSIRWIMIAAVLTLTAITLIATAAAISQRPTIYGGIDSGASVSTAFLNARLILTVLIPLYVLWYMNRAPARAFYRGYYLPEVGVKSDE